MATGTLPRWLPNAISALRIVLVPVWLAVAEWANRAAAHGVDVAPHRTLATALLVAIGVSDVVDGWLARRFSLQTRLGATLDAVADKLAQAGLCTYLTVRPGPAFATMPWWFLGVLIARDALLLLGYLTIRNRVGAVDTEHQGHGRVASLLLFLLLLGYSAGLGASTAWPLHVAIAGSIVFSTARYVQRGCRQIAARQ